MKFQKWELFSGSPGSFLFSFVLIFCVLWSRSSQSFAPYGIVHAVLQRSLRVAEFGIMLCKIIHRIQNRILNRNIRTTTNIILRVISEKTNVVKSTFPVG